MSFDCLVVLALMLITVELLACSKHTRAALITIKLVLLLDVTEQVFRLILIEEAEAADEDFAGTSMLVEMFLEVFETRREVRALNAHALVGGIQSWLLQQNACTTI